MPSEGSLPKTSCGVLHMDAQGNPIPCPVGTEPQGSASSSLDEKCRCGHSRKMHTKAGSPAVCNACPGDEERSFRHAFALAEPDPMRLQLAGAKMAPRPAEPGQCLTQFPEGQCAGVRMHPGDCTPNADDIPLPPEPEAPEEPGPTELAPCAICGDRRKTNEFKAGLLLCEPCIYGDGQPYCVGCGSNDPPFGLVSHEGEDRFNELRCAKCLAPPRRPPYAVAYSLEDGTDFEVALPGDATIRAVDGALIITHTSPVKGLTRARPMEGA